MLWFDIETDGIRYDKISKIHLIVIMDDAENVTVAHTDSEILEAVLKLYTHDGAICGHNILKYDIPVIRKFYGWFHPESTFDTFVYAKLARPDLPSHSLKAWGERIGELKGDYGETTDWQTFTPEMIDYCIQDVRVTKHLYHQLCTWYPEVNKGVFELESDVARIIGRQVAHGFKFDTEKANGLYTLLLKREADLYDKLQSTFPPWEVQTGVYLRPNKTRGIQAGDPKITQVVFNPASRDHIALKLIEKYNWKPSETTPTGKPMINESILSKLPYPEAQLIGEYLMIQKRLGQLGDGNNGWLKLVSSDTNRIHGDVQTMGTITGRMTHNHPNIAQVPAVNVPYGKECRSLFTVDKGYKLVGCDASGLELRCLAHYMGYYDNGAYAKVILEGDIHTANQEAAGLPTRPQAKRFIYAFLYGAGDELLGSLVGGTRKDGRAIRNKFLKATPALRKLKDAVEAKAKLQGYIRGLDGRKLLVRSVHSALNLLLQSAGAIIMKRALVILDASLIDAEYIPGVDYEFSANIHDEFQIETKAELADTIGKLAVEAIRKAGVYFDFRCPTDGEYVIGDSWADTH